MVFFSETIPGFKEGHQEDAHEFLLHTINSCDSL